MAERFSPNFINLVYDAALKSYWRRKAFRLFLRQCGIAESFLATWSDDESKRDLLDKLFAELSNQPKGQQVILRMATHLSEQTSFPDLEKWEDSQLKIKEARVAVQRLREAWLTLTTEIQRRREKEEAQKRFVEHQAKVKQSQASLQQLTDRLNDLAKEIGTQKAGYSFQDWFFDLLDYFEVVNRRPYVHDHRQIDGSLTHSGTTYIVELKFTSDQAGATDIDSILKKVHDKADNTMALMVSMSGYSDVAVKEASGPRTPLLLMDYRHLYLVLCGTVSFPETLERVRRHASQTGEAFLPPTEFGGGK